MRSLTILFALLSLTAAADPRAFPHKVEGTWVIDLPLYENGAKKGGAAAAKLEKVKALDPVITFGPNGAYAEESSAGGARKKSTGTWASTEKDKDTASLTMKVVGDDGKPEEQKAEMAFATGNHVNYTLLIGSKRVTFLMQRKK